MKKIVYDIISQGFVRAVLCTNVLRWFTNVPYRCILGVEKSDPKLYIHGKKVVEVTRDEGILSFLRIDGGAYTFLLSETPGCCSMLVMHGINGDLEGVGQLLPALTNKVVQAEVVRPDKIATLELEGFRTVHKYVSSTTGRTVHLMIFGGNNA